MSVYKLPRMTQTFTHSQLIRLVYGETTPAETDMLKELAAIVPEIGQSLAELEAGKAALDDSFLFPSAGVLDQILAHSRDTMPLPAN